MQIKVTADDIRQSAELLKMLESWSDLICINGDYSGGTVVLKSKVAGAVDTHVDGYALANSNPKTAVDKCQKEIRLLVGARAAQMAKDICDIIRSHMPLPL